jgi:hypothetical protein
MMFPMEKLLFVASGLVLMAVPASANLISNNSFELPGLPPNSYCSTSFFPPSCGSVPGWSGSLFIVNGHPGPGIPTPAGPPPDGSQFAEVISVSTFSQSISVPSAGVYDLTWFDATSDIGANAVYIIAIIGGNSLGTFSTTTGWTNRAVSFSTPAGNLTLAISWWFSQDGSPRSAGEPLRTR